MIDKFDMEEESQVYMWVLEILWGMASDAIIVGFEVRSEYDRIRSNDKYPYNYSDGFINERVMKDCLVKVEIDCSNPKIQVEWAEFVEDEQVIDYLEEV
jgi:hypothetical protein